MSTRSRCGRRSASLVASARTMSFSRMPLTPDAPGSRPPCPGSITTMGVKTPGIGLTGPSATGDWGSGAGEAGALGGVGARTAAAFGSGGGAGGGEAEGLAVVVGGGGGATTMLTTRPLTWTS